MNTNLSAKYIGPTNSGWTNGIIYNIQVIWDDPNGQIMVMDATQYIVFYSDMEDYLKNWIKK